MENKFTQEIKDDWLDALKSGNYTQARGKLVVTSKNRDSKVGHCCIGVLGDVCSFLNNKEFSETCENKENPYYFLKTNGINVSKLWRQNDTTYDINKPDYSNVIPLIESLPVVKS